MDTLTAMAFFSKVARAGSFSKAALELNTTASNVSKHIAFLETKLEARLLQRTTRISSLTAVGQQYLKHCDAILEQVCIAEDEVFEEKGKLSGLLKVSFPTLLGEECTANFVAEFMRRYPDIDLEIYINDRFIDLIEEGFDLCVRATSVRPDSSLIYRSIGRVPLELVGAKSYFEKNGLPKTVAELESHALIVHKNSAGGIIVFSKEKESEKINLRRRVKVNSTPFARDLVEAEQGIAFLPRIVTASRPKLQSILNEYDPFHLELSAVYPNRHYTHQKVYAFIECLSRWFMNLEDELAG